MFHTVLRNSSVMFASRVIAKAASFVFVLVTARYLGVGGYGKLSFALAITGLIAVFLDMGISQHGIRELARTPLKASQYLGSVLLLRSCLVLLALVGITLAFFVIKNSQGNQLLILVLSIAVMVGAFSGVPSILFQASQRMEFDALREILKAVLLLSTGFIAIKLDKGLVGICVSYVVAAVFDLAFSYSVLKKFFPGLSLSLDTKSAKVILRQSIPFALMVISTQFYSRVDVFMLQALDTSKGVGYYNAAYRLVETSLWFASAFVMALYPVLSKQAVETGDAFERYLNSCLKLLSFSGIFIGLCVFFGADAIIHLLYGNAFSESARGLRVLMWANALMFIGGFLATSMIAINKQWLNFGFGLGEILLNVAIDWVLIPRYGFVGATVGTLLAELSYIVVVLSYLLVVRGHKVDLVRIFLVPSSAVSVAILIAWLLPVGIKTPYLGLLMSLPFYCLVVYFFGIKNEEKQMLFGLLVPRRADR